MKAMRPGRPPRNRPRGPKPRRPIRYKVTKSIFLKALRGTYGNLTRIAERMGVCRGTLDQKLADPSTAGDGIQDKAVWEQTKSLLTTLNLTEGDVDINSFFTNDFLK